jgi:hypothetical protein
MADAEKSGAEAAMPPADINFLLTCLQNATGGAITVSSLLMMPTSFVPLPCYHHCHNCLGHQNPKVHLSSTLIWRDLSLEHLQPVPSTTCLLKFHFLRLNQYVYQFSLDFHNANFILAAMRK